MERRYIVVAGACLTQFTVIGMLFSFGLLFKTFEAEFGWSRMVLSTCSALAFLAMGILAIVAGRLSDRYGPKWVLGISGALFGFGFGLISLVNEPWHLFVIFGVFIGLGMSTHDVVTLSTIARWFEGRRGLWADCASAGGCTFDRNPWLAPCSGLAGCACVCFVGHRCLGDENP